MRLLVIEDDPTLQRSLAATLREEHFAVDTAGDGWDIGGRFDFMYGSDAVFTQAYGAPQGNWDLNLMPNDASRFYKMALPQAYVEVFAPVGNGLSTKIGHFYTIIGNEVVTAPDNFFYSHAYTCSTANPSPIPVFSPAIPSTTTGP